MKIKINTALIGANDEELVGEKGRKLTVRDVCVNSLLIPQQGDDEKKKWEKYEIYRKIKDSNDEVELKTEELLVLKKAIGATQPTLIMGQVWEMIEGS
jgi:hypothetical protein